MFIPQNLENLAKIFPKPLYVVGGFTRNFLLGLGEGTDIDIASATPFCEVENLLADTAFKIVSQCKRLGTMVIKCGRDIFEYTAFRKDSYPEDSGAHTPEETVFTEDICEDAQRRDFSVNAVYFDIKERKFIDPTGGMEDIKARIIRTTDSPERVLGEDALRIMRMVRFACVLGFSIDEKTFSVAKKNAVRVGDISPERLRVELNAILLADKKYPELNLVDAHYRGIKMLAELGVLQVIIPEFSQCIGFEQNPKYHSFDVGEHIFQAVKFAPPEVRLASLLHDIGKPYATKKDGNMHQHDIYSAEMVKRIMGEDGLKYPKKALQEVERLVALHMLNKNGNMGEIKLRCRVAENFSLIPQLTALQRADSLATGRNTDSVSAKQIQAQYDLIKAKGIACDISELKIDGNDMIALGLSGERIKKVLSRVVRLGIERLDLTTRESQLDLAKKLIQKTDKNDSI